MTRQTAIIETPAEAPIENAQIHARLGRKYDAGFSTDIESDALPPGLSEEIIRALSARKDEPEWMTDWRLAAYRHFLTMPVPHWAKLSIDPIDLDSLSYYSAPKGPKYQSLADVPQELLDTYACRCMNGPSWPAWRWTWCSTRSAWAPASARNSPRRA
jgi:Fe-S cluster assembly protein SufB